MLVLISLLSSSELYSISYWYFRYCILYPVKVVVYYLLFTVSLLGIIIGFLFFTLFTVNPGLFWFEFWSILGLFYPKWTFLIDRGLDILSSVIIAVGILEYSCYSDAATNFSTLLCYSIYA